MMDSPPGPEHIELGPESQVILIRCPGNPLSLAAVTPSEVLTPCQQLIERRNDLILLTAIEGHQGIEMARANPPGVILMDINLPGISGTAVLKVLQADPATAHIPILALSANAIPRDIEKGREDGFFGYLTKPIKIDEFLDALGIALRQAAIRRQANEYHPLGHKCHG